MRPFLTVGVLLLTGASCDGRITTPGDCGFDDGQCVGVEPGPSPLRRLTRFEYDNTIRDLLGIDAQLAESFTPEKVALGFDNQAAVLTVSPLLAEQYMEAAEQLSVLATEDMAALLPCDPAEVGELECARELIVDLGTRAYRQPLTDEQIASLTGVFTWGLEEYDFTTGIQLTVQAMLQSPSFLYRVELEDEAVEGRDVVKLDDWAIASRLSYMLWGTMPDDELFEAARLGELRTKEQVKAQAERMLDDPRAQAALRHFYGQWLTLDDVIRTDKDPEMFPEFSPELRRLMLRETEAFIDHVVWERGGGLGELLTADYTFMNAELAAFYGVEGPAGDEFEQVSLDGEERAGFLTHAGLLASHSMTNQTSPILRGELVRAQLFCMPLPPPPDDIDITPPELDPELTTRERFDAHRDDPACAGCHALMDPIGYGFERFDAIGRFRADENGLPIDDSGEIVATDVDGPFQGAVDLSSKLAQSEQVGNCAVTQLFRYTQGRKETSEDMAALTSLYQDFAASGQSFKQLLVAITQTDAFMYRSVATGGGDSL